MGKAAAESLDLDGILALAESTPELTYEELKNNSGLQKASEDRCRQRQSLLFLL